MVPEQKRIQTPKLFPIASIREDLVVLKKKLKTIKSKNDIHDRPN